MVLRRWAVAVDYAGARLPVRRTFTRGGAERLVRRAVAARVVHAGRLCIVRRYRGGPW